MALRIEGTFLLMPLPDRSWPTTNYRERGQRSHQRYVQPNASYLRGFCHRENTVAPNPLFCRDTQLTNAVAPFHSHMRMTFGIL